MKKIIEWIMELLMKAKVVKMEQINRNIESLVPELQDKVKIIQMTLNMLQCPIFVFETLRTFERQKELVTKGTSKTLKSKHIEGKACDFVACINGQWRWDYKTDKKHWDMYGKIVEYMGLTWGGSWASFPDYPHCEIK